MKPFPQKIRNEIITKHGQTIYVLNSIRLNRGKNGAPVRTEGVLINISRESILRDALIKREDEYRLLVENQTDLV